MRVLIIAEEWRLLLRNVKDYGAIGNGETLDTKAIQKAIDLGGMVYIPEGIYRIGTLYLKSNGNKYYQYTIIDEATSLRNLYWYDSKDSSTAVDFVKRAIKYFPFEIKMIQTDNGREFTNRLVNTKAISLLDRYLIIKEIEHELIKPATPWHNGRVERSHRTDDKFFYSRLSFYSLDDLRKQGKVWMRKYQNIYQNINTFHRWRFGKNTN